MKSFYWSISPVMHDERTNEGGRKRIFAFMVIFSRLRLLYFFFIFLLPFVLFISALMLIISSFMASLCVQQEKLHRVLFFFVPFHYAPEKSHVSHIFNNFIAAEISESSEEEWRDLLSTERGETFFSFVAARFIALP